MDLSGLAGAVADDLEAAGPVAVPVALLHAVTPAESVVMIAALRA
ncbi:hypothetical protein Airi02_099320 [Actinoallomurus iriomotensis]|uniref:Uncharacterized protein n=1 Tax=Actinoallomurus iriomotensis TaxID=478107 RepID=A0A9W6W608_9ACTN|nr:hypothetical protein Airi02_099320 [Actinoallomurus iriomotensis]